MNYITAAKNTKKLSETELRQNISGKASWHYQYKDSAWIYIGGLPYDLTEGDIICVFSQYGEVVNLNLPRDKKTGKSKGFCFLCYEDQRSTILAVDNLNTIKLCGRIVRVDHVEEYKVPKNIDKLDHDALRLLEEGCGPESSVVKSLQGQQGNLIKKDEKPKRELEIVIAETQPSRRRSRSPPRSDEKHRRFKQDYPRAEDDPNSERSKRHEDDPNSERSKRHEDDPNSERSKRHEDSKSSRHRETKENDQAGRHDRKHEGRIKQRDDEEYHKSHDKKRREERSREHDKERSRNYDTSRHERSRHDERSRHRDRSRSRSRDRDRKTRR